MVESSCFRLDAIAGALFVIAPMQSRATCLPSNPDLHRRVYFRAVAAHLQQSAGKNNHFDAATCRQPLVSTAISGKLARGISTAPIT